MTLDKKHTLVKKREKKLFYGQNVTGTVRQIKTEEKEKIRFENMKSNQISPCPTLADTDSVHRRRVQTLAEGHRRISLASVLHADPVKAVLPTDELTLKRHLGLFSGICFIVGIIIGKIKFVDLS